MVAIWGSGLKAGVYAIGQVVTKPARKTLNADQQKYFLAKEDITKFCEKHSVIVKYSKVIFDKPLLQDECNKDPILLEIASSNESSRYKLSTHNRTME